MDERPLRRADRSVPDVTPSSRLLTGWLPVILVIACAWPLYAWRLNQVPAFGGDEARFAVHANAIADSGRDLDGEFLPVQVWIPERGRWFQPALFYLIAGVLQVVPLSEWSARLPTVWIALLNIALIYAVGRRLHRTVGHALMPAVLLALTPAHLIFSRQALDYICPLPFMLGWLWCLLALLEAPTLPIAALAGLLLGVGVYSHVAAWLMMPFFLLLTWGALAASRKDWKFAGAATAAFAVAVMPLAIWLLSHPRALDGMVSTYRFYDASRLNPLQGARDYFNYGAMESRLSVYWDYFNPGFLFMSGGAGLTAATRRAGVFTLPLMVFVPYGLYALWANRSVASVVLLIGFLTAPVTAALVDSRYMVQRAIFLIPFGVLVASAGIQWLWQRPSRLARAATLLLLAGIPLHYAAFYADYQSGYHQRSAIWFDPAGFEGIAAHITAADAAAPVPQVYLSDVLDDGIVHWPYQLAKRNRLDLASRSQFFAHAGFDFSATPPGSLIVMYASEPALDRLVAAAGCCDIAQTVTHADGNTASVILRRR